MTDSGGGIQRPLAELHGDPDGRQFVKSWIPIGVFFWVVLPLWLLLVAKRPERLGDVLAVSAVGTLFLAVIWLPWMVRGVWRCRADAWGVRGVRFPWLPFRFAWSEVRRVDPASVDGRVGMGIVTRRRRGMLVFPPSAEGFDEFVAVVRAHVPEERWRKDG